MDWNDIPLFLALYRSGSLTQAAKDLGVVTTTVGRRVVALEAALGKTLFTRSPAGYQPTEDAHRLVSLAGDVERHMHALERNVLSTRVEVAGRVRLSTLDIIAQRLLAPAVGRLLSAYPDISLELVGELQTVSLARREAEIALRTSKPDSDSLVARTIGQIRLGLYASNDYLAARGAPAPPAHRLDGHVLVGLEERFAQVAEMQWMAERCTAPRYALRSNSVTVLEQAAAEGVGLAILPMRFGEQNARLRCVAPNIHGRSLWLVVHADLRDVPCIRVVMEWIIEVLAPWRG
jgi:DNA-binding transcriptional LysR family regulator